MKNILLAIIIITSFGFSGGNRGFLTSTMLLPGSTTLPSSCADKQIHVDTDATSGQRLYLCESGVWVVQGAAGVDGMSITIDGGAAPTVDAFGELSGDNNLWASGRGAPLFYDGTAAVALIGALVTDTPSNGQVPKWNTGGTITWETDNDSAGITAGDTQVIYSDGANNPVGDSGLTFNKTTNVLTADGGFATSTSETPYIQLDAAGTDTSWAVGVLGDSGEDNDDAFLIGVGTTAAAASSKILIKQDGNVGIGTTNPTALLTVGAGAPFTVSSTGAVTALSFTGGGAVSYWQETLLPNGAVLDDASPPALSIVESTGTGTSRRYVADFDPTTDEIVYWSFSVPSDMAAGDWLLDISWLTNDTGANEDAIWAAQISCTTEGDADSIAEDAAGTANTAAENCNATEANRLIQTTLTLSNTDSVAAGDFCTLRFFRDADDSVGDADNDGLTSDARLLSVNLRIPRT